MRDQRVTPNSLWKDWGDVATSYDDVICDAMATLCWSNDVRKRINWQPSNWTEIARCEGVLLAVVGYLSHASNVEGKEDTDGGYLHPDQRTGVDWYMYLTKKPSRPISEPVVVERASRADLIAFASEEGLSG